MSDDKLLTRKHKLALWAMSPLVVVGLMSGSHNHDRNRQEELARQAAAGKNEVCVPLRGSVAVAAAVPAAVARRPKMWSSEP